MRNNGSENNRPAWQLIAGRIARLFGIQFYDMYYGQRDLLTLPEPIVPSLSIEVCLATPKDLNKITCRIGGETQTAFEHNISIDSTCRIAVHEDTIMGYLWVNRQVVDLTGMHVAPLPPKSAFIHNVFIFPEHRRKGIFQYLFRAVCDEMQGEGFLSVGCFVDKANSQSVKAFGHEGIEFHNAAVLKLPRTKPLFYCRALA